MLFWIIVLVVLAWYVIKTRNRFEEMRQDVKQAGSNIGIYMDKRRQCLTDALNIAKIAYENEVQGVERMTAKDQLDTLLFLGQKYPDLQYTNNYSTILQNAMQLDSDISAQRVILNGNINLYNKAVTAFPGSIVASLFGYKQEKRIDEDNIKENIVLDKSDVDFSKY